MIQFSAKAAADYDLRIPQRVPGYELAQDLAAAILGAELADDATILVAGCGTGAELVRLAAERPGWRFVGVDPSAAMLAKAKTRLALADAGARASWVEAELEHAALAPCDAAVAFLVDHFLPDDGARARFLKALADALRPGAPVLLLSHEAGAWADAYGRWLMARGHARKEADDVIRRIETFWHPLTPARYAALLEAAGFCAVQSFFSALSYRGTMVRRR